MKILFFGKLRDTLGDQVELRPETGETVAGLRQRLAALHSGAADAILDRGVRACIGDEIVGETALVDEAHEVEFFPPLSGG
jgi:molybdopterin converting factor small subunit